MKGGKLDSGKVIDEYKSFFAMAPKDEGIVKRCMVAGTFSWFY